MIRRLNIFHSFHKIILLLGWLRACSTRRSIQIYFVLNTRNCALTVPGSTKRESCTILLFIYTPKEKEGNSFFSLVTLLYTLFQRHRVDDYSDDIRLLFCLTFFSSSLSTDTRLSISKIIKQKRNHCLLCLAGSFPETETQTSINRGGKRDRLLSDKKQKKRSNTIAIPLSRLFFTFQLNLTTLFLSQFCYI